MADQFDEIKNSHSEEPIPIVPETAWEDFEKYQKKRNFFGVIPWPILGFGGLGLLLIASNIFWWWNSGQHNNKTTAVTEYITDTIYISNNSRNRQGISTEFQNIEHTYSNHNYDSLIYLIKDLSENVKGIGHLESQINQLKSELKKVNQFQTLNSSGSYNYNYRSSNALVPAYAVIPASYENGITTNNNTLSNKIDEDLNLMSLREGAIELPYSLVHQVFLTPYSIKKGFGKTIVQAISPKSLSLFTEAGFIYASEHRFGESLGGSFSLGMSTLFSKHIRSRVAAQLGNSTGEFKGVEELDLSGVDVPEGGVAEEVYFDNKYRSHSIALEYVFKPQQRFIPFIGFEYGWTRSQYHKFRYEFFTPNGSVSVSGPNSPYVSSQYLGIRIGTDLTISPRIDAYFHASYLKSLEDEVGSLLLLRPGIQYHLSKSRRD